MKRRWVYDQHGNATEITDQRPTVRVPGAYVQGNFTPVMGIDDRGRARRYLRARNLVPYEDVKPDPMKAVRATRERATDVRDAYEHRRNEMRAKERYG